MTDQEQEHAKTQQQDAYLAINRYSQANGVLPDHSEHYNYAWALKYAHETKLIEVDEFEMSKYADVVREQLEEELRLEANKEKKDRKPLNMNQICLESNALFQVEVKVRWMRMWFEKREAEKGN